ncbi:MAG: SpoIVB peptidase S55 domain-containing protein [Succiniclasticum sp.]
MRHILRNILCAVCAFCTFWLGATAFARTPILPVEEIRPGMTGYAKTVLQGDTIETFPVEVLGVTGNDTQGYQILIKAGGDVMDRSGGISQGMSGSPVYLNGRLAGAIAFGKAFNDPRYCFLQPIESMLALLNPSVPRRGLPSVDAKAGSLPAGTPLLAGGFTDQALAVLKRDLAGQGLEVLDSAVSGTTASIADLQPGSAVGVALMTGDLTMGAIGTVTWTDEQGRVLAFGHPFVQRGDADFFLTKAWILTSLPNLQTSYKVGALGDTVGTVFQDRSAGVAGKIGGRPAAIPVYIAATDMDRSTSGTARVQVVHDPLLAADLISSAALSMASKVSDTAAGGSSRVFFDISATDSEGKPLHLARQNMFYSPDKLVESVTDELKDSLNVLLRNKLEAVRLQQVDVKVDLSTDSLVAEIQSAKVREEHPQAGDTIHLDVTMKPYRAATMVRTVTYKLPDDASGSVRLRVKGGASMNWIQELLRNQKESGVPTGDSSEKQPSVDTEKKRAKAKEAEKKRKIRLRDYVREVNTAVRNNDLIVEYAAKRNAETGRTGTDGEAVLTLTAMMAGGPHRQVTPMDYIIDGETTVTVQVRKAG